ncbi:MAG: flagellar basal body rod C-terminal domain-containing protein, partial [bacterium]|nr:flagellar basal body rod C-terminal domain-containing protein [bacterium]
DYQGIPYYQSQMNEWVRTFAETFNDIVTQGQDLDGNQAEVFFMAQNITDNKNPYKFGEAHLYDPITNSEDDTYYKLTAANFAVSDEMIADSRKFATTKKISDGTDKYDLVDEMLKVKSDKDMMSFRGCSSAEFLQCITADIALNANSANTFVKNFTNISKAITQQRLSVSGVDNDEEALNLVKFQNAYNLSSKMIQVMTEIYDKLIEQTGV